MRYISIELNLFKRVRLNHIKRLKLTFNEIIQLFLGTNGSGKSRLCRELSMLPADASDYEKGGSKIITCEADDGRRYTATSMFEPHTRHRLVRHDDDGDVVINDWVNTSKQRSTVEELFKMTPEIRALMLGKEKFSDWGPGKRREWFMRLNNAKYDYALAVFTKVNAEANELTAALRNTKKRLVAEQEKVVNEAELKRLNDEVNQIERELNNLMEYRAPVIRSSDTYEAEQKRQLAELQHMTQQLYRLRFIAPYPNYRDPEVRYEQAEDGGPWLQVRPSFSSLSEIATEIERLKGEVMSRDALINKAVKEHDRLKEQHDVLTKTGEAGIAELHKRFKAVHGRKVEVLSSRTLVDVLVGLDGIHPINGMGALESVWDTLEDIASTIPDNSEKAYGQAKIVELKGQLDEKMRAYNVASGHVDKLVTRKTHADNHRGNGETTCPSCSYRWTIGYNETEYQRLLNGIEVYQEQAKKLKEEMKDIEEQIARNYEYGEKYRSFIRLTQAWPVLTPLWDHLIENEFVTAKARTMMGFVERFRFDLQIMKDTLRLDAEMGEISNLIASAEKLGDATLTDVRLGLEQWSHEVEHLNSERHLLQKDVTDFTAYYRIMAEGVSLEQKITKARSDIVQTNEAWIETLHKETILHCIKQLRTSLTRKEETLSYVNMQQARVLDLQQQIEELTIKEQAARLVRDQLSPTEGLIADNLLGFIRYFIGDMNEVIERIWSYPLVVQDCAVESAGGTELDYRFPVVVDNDYDDPAGDIKEGSTGIVEVIDLAFRIAAMQCLGLGNSPLFLDEFGAHFDKHHQSTVTQVISNIMEERQFPQLFMVSHYDASYGAFTNAEICVLHPGNITIPAEAQYNQHVEMEH
jgi:energy-coupling factor transporter ATP-binding protein EcfA2